MRTHVQLLKKRQKKSKKPIGQDSKVIWEFLKLANPKDHPWRVKLLILPCGLGLWDICVFFFDNVFFEIAV